MKSIKPWSLSKIARRTSCCDQKTPSDFRLFSRSAKLLRIHLFLHLCRRHPCLKRGHPGCQGCGTLKMSWQQKTIDVMNLIVLFPQLFAVELLFCMPTHSPHFDINCLRYTPCCNCLSLWNQCFYFLGCLCILHESLNQQWTRVWITKPLYCFIIVVVSVCLFEPGHHLVENMNERHNSAFWALIGFDCFCFLFLYRVTR